MAMHEELWQKLIDLDPCVQAHESGCAYDHGHRRFTVPLIHADFMVNLEQRSIQGPGGEASFLEQLCMLSYLLRARDIPLANKLVKPEQLEAGQFFFRGHHALPTEKLLGVFGNQPDLLLRAAATLYAKPVPYGDASVEVRVLPRFPVTFVVWGGDEEFAARASVFFDETADRHLALDAIQAAVGLSVDTLVAAVEK
jgi:hypothetical protein